MGGSILTHTAAYNSRRGGKHYRYYACARLRREGASACEHHNNWPADALEQAVREYIIRLLGNPETMPRQIEQALRNGIAALRNPERKIKARTDRLGSRPHARGVPAPAGRGLMTPE